MKVPSPVIRHDTAQMVIITEIENPWSFYVQVNNPAYDNFMEDLWLVYFVFIQNVLLWLFLCIEFITLNSSIIFISWEFTRDI